MLPPSPLVPVVTRVDTGGPSVGVILTGGLNLVNDAVPSPGEFELVLKSCWMVVGVTLTVLSFEGLVTSSMVVTLVDVVG